MPLQPYEYVVATCPSTHLRQLFNAPMHLGLGRSLNMKPRHHTSLTDAERSRRMSVETQAFSNDLLSNGDQQVIREILIEAEDDDKSLEDDIARLETAIRHIHKRRTQGLARIKRLRVGIAPHKIVPPEILAMIFVYCAKMDGPTLRLPPRYENSVWNVIQVCSRWRKIAIAEPLLWSQLKVHTSPKVDALNSLVHDIFLNRGGQGVINYQTPRIRSQRQWEDVSNLLSTYPLRLRHLMITFSYFIPPALATPLKIFDDLESLTISFGESLGFRHFENTPMNAAPATRSLVKVAIHCDDSGVPAFSPWPNNAISLPWGQLTHLTIDGIPMATFSVILHCCVQLVHCEFGPQDSLFDEDAFPGPIRLENLSSIVITSNSDYSAVQTILGLLVVPALKSLVFVQPEWESWPQEAVLGLIERSKCSLETFESPEEALMEHHIIPLMRAMPKLTAFLAYTKEPILDATLDTILSKNLAPKLRELQGWQVISVCSFVRFLQRRWEGPSDAIHYVNVSVREGTFRREEQYYTHILPELKRSGREIAITPYL